MNDGVMPTWEVYGSCNHEVVYVCARLETAEYLRDWCNAERMNWAIDIQRRNEYISPLQQMIDKFESFSIQEGEVIL